MDNSTFAKQSLLVLLLALLLSACRAPKDGLSRPTGVAVGADGSLFIMDHVNRNHSRVVHISSTGKVVSTFQPKDQKTGQVYTGWDIAVGPNGNVYYNNLISNDERVLHDSVLAFDPGGVFLSEVGAYDYAIDSPDIPRTPYNLDVDNRGWIYTSDYNYNQVRVFDSQGKWITTLSQENGRLTNYTAPGDIVIDDQRSLLYMTDFFAGRLDQYTLAVLPDGSIQLALQWSLGTFGHGPRQFSFPQYLALDETTGTVYVGDMGNRRIVAVDGQGNFINVFAPPGVDDWQVLGLAVGVDPAHLGQDSLYAADAFNAVIWAFTLDGHFLRKIEVH